MTVRVLVATTNRGKVRELERLLALPEIELVFPADIGGLPEIEETGATFEANALLKARAGFRNSGLPTIGDDSGIEVDALGGAPGIYSARYASMHQEGSGDAANNRRLLREMDGVSERSARFRCVLAFVDGAREHAEHGVCEGEVGRGEQGHGGFGYDPLFRLADGRSMAELDAEEKAAISHRGQASRRMGDWLRLEWLPARLSAELTRS